MRRLLKSRLVRVRLHSATTAHGSAYSPNYAYAFGLERVLAGLSQLIDSERVLY